MKAWLFQHLTVSDAFNNLYVNAIYFRYKILSWCFKLETGAFDDLQTNGIFDDRSRLGYHRNTKVNAGVRLVKL